MLFDYISFSLCSFFCYIYFHSLFHCSHSAKEIKFIVYYVSKVRWTILCSRYTRVYSFFPFQQYAYAHGGIVKIWGQVFAYQWFPSFLLVTLSFVHCCVRIQVNFSGRSTDHTRSWNKLVLCQQMVGETHVNRWICECICLNSRILAPPILLWAALLGNLLTQIKMCILFP